MKSTEALLCFHPRLFYQTISCRVRMEISVLDFELNQLDAGFHKIRSMYWALEIEFINYEFDRMKL